MKHLKIFEEIINPQEPFISIDILNKNYDKIKNTLEIKIDNLKNLKELGDDYLDINKLRLSSK